MKNTKIVLIIFILVAVLTGCTAGVAGEEDLLEQTPVPTQNTEPDESPAASDVEVSATPIVDPEEITYFKADEDAIMSMLEYSKEFILEGYYNVFLECSEYITEITITEGVYSAGEVMCRLDGMSKTELKGIIEESLGISMKDDNVGGFYFEIEGTESDKICASEFHGQTYLIIQDADLYAFENFKTPEYYLEQAGENAFNYVPEEAIVCGRKVIFDYSEDSASFSNIYQLPFKNRDQIIEDYINGLRQMDGYEYVNFEDWGYEYHSVMLTDNLTAKIEIDTMENTITTLIQYKEPLFLDSGALDDTRAATMEDLFLDESKNICNAIGGSLSSVKLYKQETLQMGLETEYPEFEDLVANHVISNEISFEGLDTYNKPIVQVVSLDNVLEIFPDAKVYDDYDDQVVLYQENQAMVVLQYDYEQNLTVLVYDFDSDLYDSDTRLDVLNGIKQLNLDILDVNEQTVSFYEIYKEKEDEEEYFGFSRFYVVEGMEYGELKDLLQAELTAITGEAEVEDHGEYCLIESVQSSEIYDEIGYATEIWIEMPDEGDALFVTVKVIEIQNDWD